MDAELLAHVVRLGRNTCLQPPPTLSQQCCGHAYQHIVSWNGSSRRAQLFACGLCLAQICATTRPIDCRYIGNKELVLRGQGCTSRCWRVKSLNLAIETHAARHTVDGWIGRHAAVVDEAFSPTQRRSITCLALPPPCPVAQVTYARPACASDCATT